MGRRFLHKDKVVEIKPLLGIEKDALLSDWRWQLVEELYGKNFINSEVKEANIIPKKIHQIWLGGNIPEKYKEWGETWKTLHPDYEYKLWTEEDVDSLNLPNRRSYELIANPGPKSDILRFHILNQFGGIYADTDFECLRSFDSLLYLDFFTGVGYPAKIELYPGLIGCTPHHPIMERLTKEIDKVTNEDIRRKGVLGATSSYLFTKVFFDVVNKYQKGIAALPPKYFYPYPNNFPGYKQADGRKYITEVSYAIHYWEISWNKSEHKNIEIDWIQGDKFVKVADFVYAPEKKADDDYAKYPNTFNPAELKPINLVYTNTMYLARLLALLEFLPQKFVVLSHNGDQHTEKEWIGTYANGKLIEKEYYTLPDNVIKMYVQNVDVIHPRISTLPLGLENSMWGLGKKEYMLRLLNRKASREHLAFMKHSINTNREERQMVYDMFSNKPWVTVGASVGHKKVDEEYFQSMRSHKFVINPPGNCFDNHRMWEAWYLGCIPITKRSIFTSFYEDMPICLIDDWKEVTEEFLNKEYERITNMSWDREKLTFGYWRNKVQSIR